MAKKKIELTNFNWYALQVEINVFLAHSELNMLLAHTLRKALQVINPIVQPYLDSRNALVKKYGDENGIFPFLDECKSTENPNWKLFVEELEPIGNIKEAASLEVMKADWLAPYSRKDFIPTWDEALKKTGIGGFHFIDQLFE